MANKVAIALAVRKAMAEHRKGKPVAFPLNWRQPERPKVVHGCPEGDSGITTCCGKTPFELPPTDRMTLDKTQVTCASRPEGPPLDARLEEKA